MQIIVKSNIKVASLTQPQVANQQQKTGTPNTFIGDATRLWNKAPPEIKTAKTITAAKKEIKKFVMTLPV